MEDLIFSFFPSYYAFARNLPDADRLAFYDAILDYFFEGVEPSENSPVYSAFLLVQPNISNSKRFKIIGRNGGKKGGRATGACKARSVCAKRIGKAKSQTVAAKVEGIGEGNGEGKIDKLPPAPTFDAHLAFDEFWKAYPSECPRKTDKKKCAEKYARLMRDSKDPAALHKSILDGLGVWKRCETWTRDGGQFIRAPLVWLNSENWSDVPLAEGSASAQSPEEADALEAMRRANAMSAAAAQDGVLPL